MDGDTARQVRGWMERFTYKPNFEFELAPGLASGLLGDHTLVLHITMYVPDSYRKFPPVQNRYVDDDYSFGRNSDMLTGRYIDRHIEVDRYRQDLPLIAVRGAFHVPDYLDENRFYVWLRRSIVQELEMHETDEWFKVDGVPVNDPHNPKPFKPSTHSVLQKVLSQAGIATRRAATSVPSVSVPLPNLPEPPDVQS